MPPPQRYEKVAAWNWPDVRLMTKVLLTKEGI